MKLSVALKIVLAIGCLFSASCSPPPRVEKRNTSSPPPEPTAAVMATPTPVPIDPWKVASGWHGPGGPLGEAQRFLLNVPAYQCVDEVEDLANHRKSHGVARVVHLEALMMETEEPRARNGIITDGKREFVLYQGRYGQEPGDAAATLRDQLRLYSLQTLFDAGQGQIAVLSPEKLDGIQTEKYAWNMQAGGNTPLTWGTVGGRVCVWLAKDNHRPLKTEWKGNGRDWDKPGSTHPWTGTRTYHYDPNVKVTLPGS